MTKERRNSWEGSLIFSGVVLMATLSVMVFVPNDTVFAGGRFVTCRSGCWFSVSSVWLTSAVDGFRCSGFVRCGVVGLGYAWFGGFLAGTFAGLAWGRAAGSRTRGPVAPCAVDKRGFGSAAEARRLADEALHSLDGAKRGRLTVEHGSARFEVAGGVKAGMVCHHAAIRDFIEFD